MDEFGEIARLFRPLTFGAPEALELMDDAALIAGRPGQDLVVTKDAMVEGVHFLADDRPELIARKLLRVNLSDLAAKAAEPFGYFMAVAWSPRFDLAMREAFAEGLELDQRVYGLKLLGGDTVATPDRLTLSATLLGWCPAGAMVRRSGARSGDRLLVSGAIGDGGLGLEAARGGLEVVSDTDRSWLADRYRLPQPRLALREALRTFASAAADVSDGLLADAAHIGEASGAGVRVHLDRLPLSGPAARWLQRQPDIPQSLARLASLGDDYEVVCTAPPESSAAMIAAAASAGVVLAEIGEVFTGQGLEVLCGSAPLAVERTGWRHG